MDAVGDEYRVESKLNQGRVLEVEATVSASPVCVRDSATARSGVVATAE